ncbi:MAG: erythromycin esterase family protein [Pyrinomonadaceae bacterium]
MLKSVFLVSIILFANLIIFAQEPGYTFPANSLVNLGSVQHPDSINFSFLNKQIKDARIVGLGEVSHYTRECYTVKHSIIKHLAKTENFDVLVLEVDFGQGLKWNDYVEHGNGDLDALIAGTGWSTYRTKEFYDLLKSLREHNEKASRKIRVVGMEMTYIENNLKWLDTFLEASSPTFDDVRKDLDKKRKYLAFARHEKDEILDYWNLYFRMNELLSSNKEILVKNSSETDFANAERIVEIIRQYATYVSQTEFRLQTEFRDKFSTRNVFWALNQRENSKAIIWAHNGHIRKSYSYDVLGRNLSLAFGDEYFAIGFMFGEGEFGSHNDEWNFTKFSYAAPEKSTLNYKLSERKENLFFNIRENLQNEDAKFLRTPVEARADISEQLRKQDMNSTVPIILGETYDAIVFLEKTTFPTTFTAK